MISTRDMVVFGAASLLLAAVKNYNATALSLLRAGAVRSHSARWGNVLDELRELGGEKKGYIITHHAQWPLIVPGGAVAYIVAFSVRTLRPAFT